MHLDSAQVSWSLVTYYFHFFKNKEPEADI